MAFKNIALVYERSNNPHFTDIHVDLESPISELVKPSEINRIKEAFSTLKYSVEEFDGPLDFLCNISRLKNNGELVVFNKCRGLSGLERKIFVPAICKMFEIPFIGTSSYPITLARHKFHTNRLLAGLGYKVPMAYLYHPGQIPTENTNNFPVIVKPNHESGALGLTDDSIVFSYEQATSLVNDLHKKFNQPCIMESFISGEEWRVSVIGNHPHVKAIGCAGIMKNGKLITGSLQTHSDLLNGRISYYYPKESHLLEKAMETAAQIHTVLGCKDYSRCDFRISDKNDLVCMEVSTYPDIGEDSSFIFAAKQNIATYEKIVQSIIDACLRRYSHIQ